MTDTTRGKPKSPDELERGRFSDGHTAFTVRASSAVAPDSFQVFATGNPADVVMIVSGLTSGHLHATWGQGWRTFAPEWKVWLEDAAFKVFYNGHALDRRDESGGPATARHCDG
jgi:hypothetical protein